MTKSDEAPEGKGLEPPAFGSVTDTELGRRIAQLRKQADIKQAQLARALKWNAAAMSRAEAGERRITSEELGMIIDAIGTQDASQLAESLKREWVVLERPDLDHPDQGLLFEAEQVAVALEALLDSPAVQPAFMRRVGAYIEELRRISQLLLRRHHNVAFIGSMGVGKSTAICKVAGLQVEDENGDLVPVLEIGGGGVTLCEVHLRSGPGYGLVIEPRGHDEIRADVEDFAEHLLRDGAGTPDDAKAEADGLRGISQEIYRAIRNMAGLKINRVTEEGKIVRHDEAKELARSAQSAQDLAVKLLARMDLPRRARRDLWYDDKVKDPPLTWLRKRFEDVNNGRHAEVSLPKRIELVIPRPVLDVPDLHVSIIDTRGIDQAASREDIEAHLEEPHTIVLLCSAFNDAPSVGLQVLLERAKEVANPVVRTNVAILVLPRPQEALAVKDEAGIRVESAEEGYELKGEQVSMRLEPLGMHDLPTGFFNAASESPAALLALITEQIHCVRQGFRDLLREVIDSGWTLHKDHKREQVRAIQREAGQVLRAWLSDNAEPITVDARGHDSLLSTLETSYASTVNACMRRRGEWYNLSYSHQLGHGARRIAALSLGHRLESFHEHCQTLSKSHRLAREMLRQADRLLAQLYEELLRRVQLLGQNMYKEELRNADADLWILSMGEWGEGPGYKNRVERHNRRWFDARKRRRLEDDLLEAVAREWTQAAERVAALVTVD